MVVVCKVVEMGVGSDMVVAVFLTMVAFNHSCLAITIKSDSQVAFYTLPPWFTTLPITTMIEV